MRMGSPCVRQQQVTAAFMLFKLQIDQEPSVLQCHACCHCREARSHGRKHCGLPSHYAAFEERTRAPSRKGQSSWWRQGELD